MASNDAAETTLSPDEAFKALGNETRVQILRTLGEMTEPLSFSDLYERVDAADSGQFTYHLDTLTGHFVRKTDSGYGLRQAGRRVVEAIRSGAVTEAPVLEPVEIEKPCSYCGTPILVSYHEEQVQKYCPDCVGTYGTEDVSVGSSETAEYGYLGALDLPPAGLHGRSPIDVLEAAYSWSLLEHFAWAEGICPRCSASVDSSIEICEDHDAAEGSCDPCDGRYAVSVQYRCPTCQSDHGGMFANHLLTHPELLAFLLEHDVDPLSPPPRRFSASVWVSEEEVLGTDPFEATFTFTIGDDSLTMTVDDDLNVVATTRRPTSETAR
jgi:DNA-binding transcriptional ArsR family regulator